MNGESKAERLSRLADEIGYALGRGEFPENLIREFRFLWKTTPDQEKDGLSYTLQTSGIFTMAAKSTDTWSDGDLLYWDDTNNYLTVTSTSNTPAGLADGAKVATETTAACEINASVASRTV